MFEHLVARESALDLLLPRPRLIGPPPQGLMACAREWSDAVWDEARRLGPQALAVPEIARGLDMAGRPVFVCGVHRSGTTLVRNLLDGHPALAVLPSEGSFYTNHRRHLSRLDPASWQRFMAGEWCRRLANPINQPPYWLIGRSSPAESPSVEFVRSIAGWWPAIAAALSPRVSAWPLTVIALAYASRSRERVDGEDVTRWVEKTPTNEQFLSDIWHDFPEAKVVHVVRDPVAVIVSRKAMEQRATGGFGAVRSALADLAESYRIAEAQRTGNDRGRYRLIRFEDLLESPKATVDRLAEFLELDNLPILHQPTSAGQPTSSNSSFAATAGAVIDRTRVRVDAESLSAEERLRLAVEVGDAAATLGYVVPA